MKRGNKKKLAGFMTRMRNEYRKCVLKGHHARARQIKYWLKVHVELAGIKDAA